MDRQSLERLVENYSLVFLNLRDPQAERGRFPSFIGAFNRSMEESGTVPTQDEFIADYARFHDIQVTQGLEARMRRTYPSLVRELHARLMATEIFPETKYSLDDDLAGVDLTIRHNGEEHYIHLFVDTKRSNHFRMAKDNRHAFEGSHIDVSLNLSSGRKVGQFLFYPEATFRTLREALDRRVGA